MTKTTPRTLLWEAKRRLLRRSEGEAILLQRYADIHGKPLNLDDPRTFTEKLTCRMIGLNRGLHPEFTALADKFAVRTIVSDKVGDEHLVNLLWHGRDPVDIPFDDLPERYVVKTNHGSGSVVAVEQGTGMDMAAVPDRVIEYDRDEIVNKLSAELKTNYYWAYREYQYYRIKPRVMVEESIKKGDGSRLLDYKYFCFNGVPEVIQVDDNYVWDLHPFFDPDWNQVELYYRDDQAHPHIERPPNLEQMNSIASKLSEGIDFVRLDLYNVEGRVYFGEFTFTPTAGEMVLRPESWDLALGDKWEMSDTLKA
jgi:hypothetical protein